MTMRRKPGRAVQLSKAKGSFLKFSLIWVKVYYQVELQTYMALDACSVLCCLLLKPESHSVKSLQTRIIPLLSCMDSALSHGSGQPGCTSQVCLKCFKWFLKYNVAFHLTFFHFPAQQLFSSLLFPSSGTCLLPLSLQPTNVCCCLSCCPGSRMLLDKRANLGDHGNSGFPQSIVVRSPLAARPHSPSSPFPLLLHPCAHRESWAWEPERSPLSKDHQMQLKMKNLMDQMD